jgi:hypothetical protein
MANRFQEVQKSDATGLFFAPQKFSLETFFDFHNFFRQPRGGFGNLVTTGDRFAR